MSIVDFTKLLAWQNAMDLAVKVHEITSLFPSEGKYALVSQMRRAAVSVHSNIAEGFARFTYADKKNKYVLARGELVEIMSDAHYSHRVHYISDEIFQNLLNDCDQVYKLVNGLISRMSRLHKSQVPSPKSQVLSPKS